VATSNEFDDWLQHPITKEYFEELKAEEQAMSYGLSQGAYSDDPNERLFMGYVRAIREAINPENIRESIVEDSE
jgi:hypothetical protein